RSAWSAYVSHAWPNEALKPVSNEPYKFGRNSGRTIVASLSTLWVMGLKDEFEQGKKWVKNELDFDKVVGSHHWMAEHMGGLLSAYALTSDEMFASKAKAIADKYS